MDPKVNGQMQTEWGWLIAIYLFLGGVGAGAYTIAAINGFLGRERWSCRPPSGCGSASRPCSIGSLFLLADLGSPDPGRPGRHEARDLLDRPRLLDHLRLHDPVLRPLPPAPVRPSAAGGAAVTVSVHRGNRLRRAAPWPTPASCSAPRRGSRSGAPASCRWSSWSRPWSPATSPSCSAWPCSATAAEVASALRTMAAGGGRPGRPRGAGHPLLPAGGLQAARLPGVGGADPAQAPFRGRLLRPGSGRAAGPDADRVALGRPAGIAGAGWRRPRSAPCSAWSAG